MRKIFFTLTLVVLCLSAAAQTYTPSTANLEAREEFSNYKFGIFIHWGLYSMLGDGEWIMNVKNLNYEEYAKLAGGFYPSKFDAKEWVTTFKNAGAKYMTITTRHHDGFSMFDTRQSDFNIVKATPFGRDIIGELAEACKDQGLALHFYYSHLDWTRLDYWPLGREGHGVGRPEGKSGDWDKYIQFMENQFTELIQNYHPKAMWFDGIWDKKGDSREDQYKLWKLEEQYELIHRLDPACLIGNNHHQIPFPGEDIEIFEQDLPGKNEGGFSGSQGIAENFPLETCRTMNNSWGYSITDKAYRDSRELIQYLVKASGKGANLLLNIGPRPDGKLPDEAVSHLKDIGDWLRVYGVTTDDEPTAIANYIFNDEKGRDPFIEDLGTLWLLHFLLVSKEEATLYNWLFVRLQRERKVFDRQQVVNFVKRLLTEDSKQSIFNENTVKKDVGVLLQSYVLPQKAKALDDYSALMIDLDLLRITEDGKSYQFNIEGKRQVPWQIFLYAILQMKGEDKTVSYDTLQDIGLMFCMNDIEVIEMCKVIESHHPDDVRYTDTAGNKQIQFINEINSEDALEEYYG